MSVYRSDRPPTRRELRAFAWSVGAAFVALAGVAAWRGRSVPAIACGGIGAALWLAGALAPARLAGVYRAWMRGALAISAVTTPVLMGVVYFGVLTPMALVARLAGRRALGVPRDAATAWVDRPPDARRSDLRRQF
jgi:dihydrodipicolinate synthase/N-acetylneuraminate lyase